MARVKPRIVNGRFANPWDTWEEKGAKELLKWMFERRKYKQPDTSEAFLERELPVLKPDFEQLAKQDPKSVSMTWLGHASTLVRMNGLTFLCDPVFSHRCSPFQQFGGSKRYRPCPVQVSDLPKIDFTVVSHSHYDHLDESTITGLLAAQGDTIHYYVPTGLKEWFKSHGVTKVTELGWWEEAQFNNGVSTATVVGLPAQHWSMRTPFDRCKSLWCGFAVLGSGEGARRFYYSGDTGYCPVFKEIGEAYGPFDAVGVVASWSFLSPRRNNDEIYRVLSP